MSIATCAAEASLATVPSLEPTTFPPGALATPYAMEFRRLRQRGNSEERDKNAERAGPRAVADGLRRGQVHDLLHVRMPVRNQSPSTRRKNPPHRRQSQSPGEQGRAVRQGRLRDHATLFSGAAAQTAQARRRARQKRIRRDRMGRGPGNRNGMAHRHSPQRSQEAGVLHRTRSEPVADGLVGRRIRNAEFRRPRRILFGEYGCSRLLHDRRLVLGIRRTRLGAYEVFYAFRRRRGS